MPRCVMKSTMKRQKKPSYARLTPAMRNRITGMQLAGAARNDMRDKVRKTDGTPPTLKSVDQILAQFAEDPEWDGENSSAGGRPRLLTAEQEKK